ncbi:MAG: hypothetical protein ACT4PJ_08155 [Gemmatimonadaceae bacterium]
MTRIHTAERRGSGARFSASDRPVPAYLARNRAPAVPRPADYRAEAALRFKITAASLGVFALLVVVANAPRMVGIPLAITLLTALAVVGVLRGVAAFVDRQMRVVGAALSAGSPPRPATDSRA